MRTITKLILSTIVLSALAFHPSAFSQGTAFTYQGRLTSGTNVANGSYDLTFTLFGVSSGGSALAGPITNAPTSLNNGLFAVTLDFGNQYPGAPRWLEIGVRTNGGAAFTTLTPRQLLTSTPYAIQASNATTASSVAAANITGSLTTTQLPSSVVTNGASGVNFTGTFTGNGAALSNVSGTLPAQNVSSGIVSAQPNRAYNTTGTSPVSVTLPTTAVIGDLVQVNGLGAGGWQVQATNGQAINGFAVGDNWAPALPTANWRSLAVSADGNTAVAVTTGNAIFLTTDAGVTWAPRPYTNSWTGVASSADGGKWVAVAEDSQIYLSTDSGTTWSPTAFTNKWRAVASSDDGNKLVAVLLKKSTGGPLYTSTDAGATWTLRPFTNEWLSVASSANGSRLIAGTHNQRVFLSRDGGTNWTPTLFTNGNWSAVASSADGNKLVAAADVDAIYTSADGGTNWTVRPYTNNWISLASSADGSTLVAGTFGDRLYISRDGGTTWTPHGPVAQWFAVACSADGSRFFAAEANGQLYVSSALVLAGAQGTSVSLRYAGNGVWQPTDLAASSTNWPNTTVARDAYGNFTAGNISATRFNGDGSGLTNLRASQLSSGTVPDSLLSSNVALRAGDNTFAGNQLISSGNVGIGTTNPSTKLTVQTTGGDYGIEHDDGDIRLSTFVGAGAGWLGTVSAHPLCFYANNGSAALAVAPNQNVGIGTSSPGFPLSLADVLGDKICLWGNSGNGGNHYGLGVQANQLQIHTLASADDVVFGYGQSASMTETMRIKGNGNVGIGTNSPANKLHVRGNATIGTGGSAASMTLDDTSNAKWSLSTAGFKLAFRNDNGGAFTDKMVIHNNGNVGIGTNSSGARLQIAGAGIVNLFAGDRSPFGVSAFETDFNAPQTHIWCAETGTNVFNVTPGGAGFFAGSVGIGTSAPTNKLHVIGGATFSGGTPGANQNVVWVPGSGSWSFTSDRNAKDRVETVNTQSVLDKVARMPIKEWSYIGYDQRHIGPMAQDFHEQFPLNENDKSLNDADLHGVALAAIQGLNQKLESGKLKAENRIEMLEAENQHLKQRLEKLEGLLNQKLDKAD